MKKIKFICLIILIFALFSNYINADNIIYASDVMQARIYTDSRGTELPYQIYIPDGEADKFPVLIYLHGSGHRGSDNQIQVNYEPGLLFRILNSEYSDCILVAPQCENLYQWVETPWSYGSYDMDEVGESKYLHAVYELIISLIENPKADPDRIYISGISMGGYGTWDMILRYPELFAAAVPICGAGDPSKAENIRDLPVWFFHGDFDHVVPPNGSRDMANALKEIGGKAYIYSEYKNVDHDSWVRAYSEPDLLDWMFSKLKSEIISSDLIEEDNNNLIKLIGYFAAVAIMVCVGIIIWNLFDPKSIKNKNQRNT